MTRTTLVRVNTRWAILFVFLQIWITKIVPRWILRPGWDHGSKLWVGSCLLPLKIFHRKKRQIDILHFMNLTGWSVNHRKVNMFCPWKKLGHLKCHPCCNNLCWNILLYSTSFSSGPFHQVATFCYFLGKLSPAQRAMALDAKGIEVQRVYWWCDQTSHM